MHKIHMMGIGGIGMSAIARLLVLRGEKVSGCDIRINPLIDKLKAMGAEIFEGHSPGHIDDSVSLLVHSSAIENDHPELMKARSYSIPIFRRAQMLTDIIKDKKLIAITGTHGKTTTSFMITHIMNYAGMNPGFAIGGEPLPCVQERGEMNQLGGNSDWGESEYFVVEADESDGTHLYLKPEIAVVTNIDCDHMEYYSGISHIAKVMEGFIDKVAKDGLVVGCGECPEVRKLLRKAGVPNLSYGYGPENDIYPTDLELDTSGSRFNLWYKGLKIGEINLNIPGRHNVLNALAGIGVCLEIGIPFSKISSALNTYPGIRRRLDIVFQDDEVTVMDDYAHHPNEIRVVIDTVRQMAKGRLIGIFQPHRFTRTRFLKRDFSNCFVGLDKLILTDIYSAGEVPIPGVTGRLIYDEVIKFGNPYTIYIESKDDILECLLPQLIKGDTVLFMGAGDITELAHKVRDLSQYIVDVRGRAFNI